MSLRWKIRETRDSEIATANFAGLRIVVQDCDGDRSWWEIRDPSKVVSGQAVCLAHGDCSTIDPYHMTLAQVVAERCVREIVAARKTTVNTSDVSGGAA